MISEVANLYSSFFGWIILKNIELFRSVIKSNSEGILLSLSKNRNNKSFSSKNKKVLHENIKKKVYKKNNNQKNNNNNNKFQTKFNKQKEKQKI